MDADGHDIRRRNEAEQAGPHIRRTVVPRFLLTVRQWAAMDRFDAWDACRVHAQLKVMLSEIDGYVSEAQLGDALLGVDYDR